jgi:hypothetical protein
MLLHSSSSSSSSRTTTTSCVTQQRRRAHSTFRIQRQRPRTLSTPTTPNSASYPTATIATADGITTTAATCHTSSTSTP